MMPRNATILHVITGLGAGGAEAMLEKLISAGRLQHRVVSLGGRGVHGVALRARGVQVDALNMNRPGGALSALPRLAAIVRQETPVVVQGWMNHGNLMAAAATFLVSAPLVWNVRQSLHDLRYEKWVTRRIIELDAQLSRRPQAIIYNSTVGAQQHEAAGFDASRRFIIPNGFDLERFQPAAEPMEARRALGLADEDFVIGLVARFHPMKNHVGFFQAASLLLAQVPTARFVLAGTGTNCDNAQLTRLMPPGPLRERTMLLGERDDVPAITSALDIACNVSVHGEGFPNAIGEAMACGVPCVVTDVGDTAQIVGKTGLVCATTTPEAIADAFSRLERLGVSGRRALGEAARRRAEEHFSLNGVVQSYEQLYEEVLETWLRQRHSG